jgi:hypothetical protein
VDGRRVLGRTKKKTFWSFFQRIKRNKFFAALIIQYLCVIYTSISVISV